MKEFSPDQILPPAIPLAPNVVKAVHISLDDFLTLFDESVHGLIRGNVVNRKGITHVVAFENLDAWSSECGKLTAVAVGSPTGPAHNQPSWSLEDIVGKPYVRLGDVPSRFQYPVAYADVGVLLGRPPVTRGDPDDTEALPATQSPSSEAGVAPGDVVK